MLDFPEKGVTNVYGSTVIIITRGWVGVKFPGKKRCVTLEWPLCSITYIITQVNLVSMMLIRYI